MIRAMLDHMPSTQAYQLGWEECLQQQAFDATAAEQRQTERWQSELAALVDRVYEIAPYPEIPEVEESERPPPLILFSEETALLREARLTREDEALTVANGDWRPLT